MANIAAYSGLRWDELIALTVVQVNLVPGSSPSTARWLR